MLKATELRIGNWITDSFGANRKVAELRKGVVIELEHEIIDNYRNCKPISLTPRILERAGFVKQVNRPGSSFTQYIAKGMMLLIDNAENPFSNIEAYYERHFTLFECIGYRHDLKLHELQNLYFALTGEELNVELGDETSATLRRAQSDKRNDEASSSWSADPEFFKRPPSTPNS
jgi:hypothetical protein